MAASTAALVVEQRRERVAVHEDAHLQERLVQQHAEAVHDGAADGEPAAARRTATGRRRRRGALRAARAHRKPHAEVGAPRQRADDEVGVVDARELADRRLVDA